MWHSGYASLIDNKSEALKQMKVFFNMTKFLNNCMNILVEQKLKKRHIKKQISITDTYPQRKLGSYHQHGINIQKKLIWKGIGG